ncbi:hypothetical protein EVAR_57809_1 [Eumeta japonica]|uniref:Uncharacterized protein n=1 Tax=Eumeta variegata TaxID=151549 RepID=A0A4C1Z7I9_EUMVA|nr:hypothetical protein EVAR_57809_1 [Eumeta japonica]
MIAILFDMSTPRMSILCVALKRLLPNKGEKMKEDFISEITATFVPSPLAPRRVVTHNGALDANVTGMTARPAPRR